MRIIPYRRQDVWRSTEPRWQWPDYDRLVLSMRPNAYWPLLDVAGNTLDWTSSKNNLTVNGGTTRHATSGPMADGLTGFFNFDGVSGSCTSGAVIAALNPSVISFAMWIRLAGAPGVNVVTIDSSQFNISGYRFITTTTAHLLWSINPGAGAVQLDSGALSLNAWHFLVGICDNVRTYLYLDNLLIGSSVASLVANTVGQFALGANNGPGQWTACDMAKVALFAYPLSPDQIDNLWRAALHV